MGLSVDQLAGLVSTTLSNYQRDKITDIASDLQEYVVMSKLLKEDKVTFDGGETISFNVTSELGSNARNVGLYEVDNVNVSDSHALGEVPWRFTETSYAFDTREKKLNNPTPERLFDLIKLRRGLEIGGLAKLMEDNFWGKPATSSDKTTPFGIDYWMVRSSAKTAIADAGFNGGNPTGFSSGAAGLDSSTYTNWKNWAANYTNVTKDDIVRKMKKAARNTHWMSPLQLPENEKAVRNRFQCYCNEETIAEFEEIGEAQNENLGRDIDSMSGTINFQRNPIIYVPKLDADSGDPLYMVDWSVFCIYMLEGEFMRETVKVSPTQHNVVNVFVDLSWNTICYNRRKLAILSK